MEKQIISKFSELPKLKITWWMIRFVAVLIILNIIINYLIINPWPPVHSESEIGNALFILIILIGLRFVFLITGLILGIISKIKGEKSWVLWIGFILLITTGILILSGH